MGMFNRNKHAAKQADDQAQQRVAAGQGEAAPPRDAEAMQPVAKPSAEGAAAGRSSARGATRKEKRAAKRAEKRAAKGVVRIEDLEDLIEKEGLENIDPETAVSMYLPKRRMARIGAALLRLDKLQKALIALALVFGLLFAL